MILPPHFVIIAKEHYQAADQNYIKKHVIPLKTIRNKTQLKKDSKC
jgi:hypothetical protein